MCSGCLGKQSGCRLRAPAHATLCRVFCCNAREAGRPSHRLSGAPERSPFALKTQAGWGQTLRYATALPAFLMHRLQTRGESEQEGESPAEPTGPPLEDTRQAPECENFPSLARNSCSTVTESGTCLRVSFSVASNRHFSSQKHGTREGKRLAISSYLPLPEGRPPSKMLPQGPCSLVPPAPTVQAWNSPYLVVPL